MAYHRRSPMCRACYQTGHTKRGCPTLIAKATAAAAKPAADRDWSEQRAIDMRETYTKRSCTYCMGEGHNSKGCTTRKEDMRTVTTDLVKWRINLVNAIKTTGCNVGAIISHRNYISGIGYPADPNGSHYELVTGINYNSATHWAASRDGTISNFFETKNLANFNSPRYNDTIASPEELRVVIAPDDRKETYTSERYKVRLVTPSFDFEIPAEFTSLQTCKNLVEILFNTKLRRNRPVTRSYIIECNLIADSSP